VDDKLKENEGVGFTYSITIDLFHNSQWDEDKK
jgi:hypothetical protein